MSKQLKVIHWNCAGFKNKPFEFSQMLRDEEPDIVAINELKCDTEWANSLLIFDGYVSLFKVRDARANRGGGVAI
jgi:exonuclease III